MPEYRRLWIPGGTFFFTVVTHKRMPILCHEEWRAALRKAITDTRINYPFETIAWVLLPNHLHCIWKLPEGDSDYSTRWRLIKARFSRTFDALLESPSGPNASRERHAERHLWQRRFWEHGIRDQDDFNRHIDYVHFNPVKHGLVVCRVGGFHPPNGSAQGLTPTILVGVEHPPYECDGEVILCR